MGQMQKVSGRKTKVTTENGVTRVRYHDTDVVSFDKDVIVLRTGGRKSVTTKARMNQTANQYDLGYTVFQRDFAWFVATSAGDFPFDSWTITFDRATMRPIG